MSITLLLQFPQTIPYNFECISVLLCAVSHAVGAHTDALQPSQHAESSDDDNDDEQLTPTAACASAAASVPGAPAAADTPLRCCDVCLLASIEGFALVPCGHE